MARNEESVMEVEELSEEAVALAEEVAEGDRYPVRRNLSGRAQGIFSRRGAQRISVEAILHRAKLLPREPRAIVQAFYYSGMTVQELAVVHKTTPLRMWRSLNHLRDTLSDPAFLLTARFRGELPYELRRVADAHWICGRSIREVAVAQKMTLHAVRKKLARARSMLVVAVAERGAGGDVRRML